MRLTPQQVILIKREVVAVCGDQAEVVLFGSRVDDLAKGGDVDLLICLSEPNDHPAELSARVSARVSRQLGGRQVDAVIKAPNLAELPIHQLAQQQGVRL